MRLDEALSDLRCIQSHLRRAELATCYRSMTIGFSGCAALVAAIAQSLILGGVVRTAGLFVLYWGVVAAASVAVIGGEMAWRYFTSASTLARQHTRSTLADSLPSVGIGAILSLLVLAHAPHHAPLLPALWSIMFSLGTWASRRRLPPAAIWVSAHYFLAALIVVRYGVADAAFPAWTMALTFGVGQCLAAIILYRTRGATHGGES